MTLLPEFRAQLQIAAYRCAGGRRHRVVSRLSIDGLTRVARTIPVLLSVLVAVGIAVVAIATLSHHHVSTAPPTTSSRKELLQTIGVLRRPQTKADLRSLLPRGEGGAAPGGMFRLAMSPVCRGASRPVRLCSLTLDRPLVRTVTARGGYRVAIFPTIVTRSIAGQQPGEGVVITLRGPGVYLAVSDLGSASIQAIRARGLLLSTYVSNGVNRGVILVPDGVARVALGQFKLEQPAAANPPAIGPATSAVSNNLALLQLNGLTAQNLHLSPTDRRLHEFFYQGSGQGCQVNLAIYGLPAAAEMTWLDASGKVIRNTTIHLLLYMGVQHPAPGTTTQNPTCAQRQH